MGGSISSRLFQEVREKRSLAYTTYAFDVAYSDTRNLRHVRGAAARTRSTGVEAIMRAQLEDLAADGPPREMTRVRGQVRGGVV